MKKKETLIINRGESLKNNFYNIFIELNSDECVKINYSNNQNQSQDISDKNSQKINNIFYLSLAAFIDV